MKYLLLTILYSSALMAQDSYFFKPVKAKVSKEIVENHFIVKTPIKRLSAPTPKDLIVGKSALKTRGGAFIIQFTWSEDISEDWREVGEKWVPHLLLEGEFITYEMQVTKIEYEKRNILFTIYSRDKEIAIRRAKSLANAMNMKETQIYYDPSLE